MLKQLLFAAAVATALTASAEVVWTGSAPLDWNNGKALQVEASAFSSVQAGDQILVNFTMDAGASYANMFFCIDEDGWPHMANNDNRTNINSYNSYPPGTTNSAVKVTAADATGLKANGLALMGEKLTVTSVEVVAAADAPADNIWTGSEDLGNWGNLIIPTSYTKNLQAGATVDIYFTVGDLVEGGNVYGKMMFKSTWTNELNVTPTNVNEYGAFEPGVTSTRIVLDATDAAAVAANELIISGYNVTITKVVFNGDGNEGGGDQPGTGGDSTDNVWTGSENLGNWGNLVIDAKYCKGLKEGDIVTMFFTVGSDDTYGKVILKDGSWAELTALQATLTNVNSYGAFEPGTTSASMTLSASDAATLVSGGLIISGYNVTITKVVFGTDESGDDPIAPPTGGNVWEGNSALGNWNNLEIPASYCKNLQAGDIVTMFFTVGDMVDNGSVYGKVILKDGDWNQLDALQATMTNVDSYGAFQPEITSASVTLSADDAATLAAGGLIISGYNVTITKVVFGDISTDIVFGPVDNSEAPVEYYNLQGVRVNEPARGTIVIRRQGNEVKKILF